MFARLADWLVRHPVIVLLFQGAVTAAAVLMASRIQFDFAPQSMLRGSAELRRELDEFKRTFAYEDSVLIVVLEATGTADVLTPEALTWQYQVAQEIRTRPQIQRVDSVATMETIRRGLQFPPRIESVPVISEAPVDPETAARVRRLVDRSPLLEGSLLSENRQVSALMCFLRPDVQTLEAIRGAIADVQGVLAAHPPPANFTVHLTGLPYLRVDTVDNLQADQQRLLPIAAALYLLLLGLIFRRRSGTLIPLLAVGMGLAWTIGGLVLIGEKFNLISNILPILLLVIGVSNCVHIVADYGEVASRMNGDRSSAMSIVMRHMGFACLLSMLTTAIGFASLFNARSDVLVAFGWQCAWGMACLYVCIMSVLGSLLQFFRPPPAARSDSLLSDVVTRAADQVDSHPKFTLAIAIAVMAFMVWSSRTVRVNASMIETYEPEHPTLRTLRLVERTLGGLLPLEISLRADRPGQFLEPEIYRRVKRLEEFARAQEGVLFARSYVDLHDAIGAGITRRTEDSSVRDESDAAIRRRLERSQWLVERVGESLSYGTFMTADQKRARVLIKASDLGTRRLHQVIRRIEERMRELFPPELGIHASMTGDAYVNTLAMENVIRDLFSSLLTAAVVIFSVIAIGFRSVRAGLISAVPNVTPLVFTLGYMGLRGFEMNVSNVIVFTISLGIAVDDTIHFLARFREQMKMRRNVMLAVHHTYAETGRAIVIVTVLVISGLSVLLLSDFVPTRRFAELTIVTMSTAVFGDLLLLPACLVLFWKPGTAQIDAEPETA